MAVEITFIEPKTSCEAYVLLGEAGGKAFTAYVWKDSSIFDPDHEDADRLSGFTWVEGQCGLFLHCEQPKEFLGYLLDEWELSADDRERLSTCTL